MVAGRLAALHPTGYSAAGVVTQVGVGIDNLRPGMAVACAGAQFAHHAEVIRVPRNLLAPVPEDLGLQEASTVTLGAIALQGVRRAVPTLGETFVVVGLGLIGQLTAQLLKSTGCRVIGVDPDAERVSLAVTLGLNAALDSDAGDDAAAVRRLTGGVGADGVIITAASNSDQIVSSAFRMCRKKGRVVLVGDVGLNLDRADFYEKELDFFISSSYGPGRYDRSYEELGLDYPVGYVRWTENRNMEEYLRLVAEGRVMVRPLITDVVPLTEAPAAYSRLQAGTERPLSILLAYPEADTPDVDRGDRVVRYSPASHRRSGSVRLALVGAGAFARATHLPNLTEMGGRGHLHAVVSGTGAHAAAVAREYDATYATTDLREALEDPAVDAVLITTRHDRHGAMTLEALQAGKNVMVEKPLALTASELEAIERFFSTAGEDAPILFTGFNRRFSPHVRKIWERTERRSNPLMMSYRMNAGFLPPEHWTHGPEGGGRNLGEACHIYDLFCFLTGNPSESVHAQPIRGPKASYGPRDNFVATVAFRDGSVGTLTYTAMGHGDHPKERMDVYWEGQVMSLDDYRRLEAAGVKGAGHRTRGVEKGHREGLSAFLDAVRTGGEWPIPLEQQLDATRIALRVEAALVGHDQEAG
jgi:predicted dehydrogenase/threonine dehydrogenase-like Zn-dependent dehydrogenase